MRSCACKEQTSAVVIPDADHFFAGHLPELEKTIADWLVSRHPDFVAHARSGDLRFQHVL